MYNAIGRRETLGWDCGSGMFIPDPNFSIPDQKIPDPLSASKNLSFFNPKTVSKISEI